MNIPETIDYVYRKFNGKFRKGTVGGESIPAFIHATSVFHAGYRIGINEPYLLKALLCHDLLEDTDTTVAELRDVIGDKATDIVIELTFDPAETSKATYLQSFRHKSIESVVCKIIDRIENVKDFRVSDAEYAPIYFRKANELFNIFAKRKEEGEIRFGVWIYAAIHSELIRGPF